MVKEMLLARLMGTEFILIGPICSPQPLLNLYCNINWKLMSFVDLSSSISVGSLASYTLLMVASQSTEGFTAALLARLKIVSPVLN